MGCGALRFGATWHRMAPQVYAFTPDALHRGAPRTASDVNAP